jgi:hypothetical protein
MTAPALAAAGISVDPLFVRWIQLEVTDRDGMVHTFQCEVTQAGLTSTGGDAVSLTTLCPEGSFSENAERVWQLAITGVQDFTTLDSLVMFLLQHDGEEGTFIYYPRVDKAGGPVGYGFTGTVTFTPPDNVGNAASGAYATFTATLPLKGKYSIVDASGAPLVIVAATATAGAPGYIGPTGAPVPADLAALNAAGLTANPTTAWETGLYVVLGDASKAAWNGTTYIVAPTPPVKSAAKAGDVFPAEATITASDSTNAAKLAGLGYVASPLTAWTTGQKMTVGTFDFNWSGTAWAAGAHA